MENNLPYIIACDFDGVLCEENYPDIGKPNTFIINKLIAAQSQGVKVILWTCRSGVYLKNAIQWSAKHGLRFDAVNKNLPEVVEYWGGVESRKISANEYWDDKAIRVMMNEFEYDWTYSRVLPSEDSSPVEKAYMQVLNESYQRSAQSKFHINEVVRLGNYSEIYSDLEISGCNRCDCHCIAKTLEGEQATILNVEQLQVAGKISTIYSVMVDNDDSSLLFALREHSLRKVGTNGY